MAKYNGHRSWAYWNVSLWISNDEGLYNMAREHVRHCRTKRDAAKAVMQTLEDCGLAKTPDGATYSVDKILSAIRGLE